FAGAKYLVDNNIPTFGWNINAEWNLGPNLFGEKGSNLCFDCPNAWLPYLAKQTGFTNVGILTYTAVQSQDCAKGWEAAIEQIGGPKAGLKLTFKDNSLPIVQYLPNGYDNKLISQNAAVLEGDYVTVSFFPFEADQKPQAL